MKVEVEDYDGVASLELKEEILSDVESQIEQNNDSSKVKNEPKDEIKEEAAECADWNQSDVVQLNPSKEIGCGTGIGCTPQSERRSRGGVRVNRDGKPLPPRFERAGRRRTLKKLEQKAAAAQRRTEQAEQETSPLIIRSRGTRGGVRIYRDGKPLPPRFERAGRRRTLKKLEQKAAAAQRRAEQAEQETSPLIIRSRGTRARRCVAERRRPLIRTADGGILSQGSNVAFRVTTDGGESCQGSTVSFHVFNEHRLLAIRMRPSSVSRKTRTCCEENAFDDRRKHKPKYNYRKHILASKRKKRYFELDNL